MQENNFSSDLIISEDVIATIAANAAKDVEGVAGLGTRPADVLLSVLNLNRVESKNVCVKSTDFDIKVQMYVKLYSNAKIQMVCSDVQKAVKTAIQNMTGKYVTRVDVTVTGVEPAPQELSQTELPDVDLPE